MEEKKTKEPQYNEPKMMLHLAIYSAVGKYKSIRRAIRKGHVTSWGTDGREMQITKERIYGQLTGRSQAN